MTSAPHQGGGEKSPFFDNQQAISEAEKIMAGFHEACKECPAARLCMQAINENNDVSPPRTPADVRNMRLWTGGWGGALSGSALLALMEISAYANELKGTGPNKKGDRCCLDTNTAIGTGRYSRYY
jgi:hypothetical protein